MRSKSRFFLFLPILMLVVSNNLVAEIKKVALVIGNSSYSTGPLKIP